MSAPSCCWSLTLTRTPAYCAGHAAYRAGVARNAGPHEGATGVDYHLRYDWKAGWDDAEIDAARGEG